MSTRPHFSTVAATVSSTSARLSTSHRSANASPPRSEISATTASHLLTVRPVTATLAPSAANASAIPRPTPWPAPVTIATRSFSTSTAAPSQVSGWRNQRLAKVAQLVAQLLDLLGPHRDGEPVDTERLELLCGLDGAGAAHRDLDGPGVAARLFGLRSQSGQNLGEALKGVAFGADEREIPVAVL